MSVEVTLTDAEFAKAVEIGMRRYSESAASGLDHATTYRRDPLERLEQETIGACGELAVGKALGVGWGRVNTFHGRADAGRWEVRSTAHRDGRLILRPWEFAKAPELLDRIFILVVGRPLTVTIVGSIRGRDAADERWLDDPNGLGRPAYFVPQDALRPFRPARAA